VSERRKDEKNVMYVVDDLMVIKGEEFNDRRKESTGKRL